MMIFPGAPGGGAELLERFMEFAGSFWLEDGASAVAVTVAEALEGDLAGDAGGHSTEHEEILSLRNYRWEVARPIWKGANGDDDPAGAWKGLFLATGACKITELSGGWQRFSCRFVGRDCAEAHQK